MKQVKKPTVYLETTAVSYAVGRLNRIPENVRKQRITRKWWESSLPHFEPIISEYVVQEISEGDPKLAVDRRKLVASFRMLFGNDKIEKLGDKYLKAARLTEKDRLDTYHIACATIYRIDFLLTWNLTHINNGIVRKIIEDINRGQGINTPIICTPEELMEVV